MSIIPPNGYDLPDFRTIDEILNDSLMAFTNAVGLALDGVCSYGLTIGESYVPFDPDPEDNCPAEDDKESSVCTQAWVRVMGVSVVDATDHMDGSEGFSTSLSVDLEVGVIRCLDIPEGGEAPTASDMLVAAAQSMADMHAIYCAAMSEEVWDMITAGQWSPMGPLGGQYGGMWNFTVVGPCAPPVQPDTDDEDGGTV